MSDPLARMRDNYTEELIAALVDFKDRPLYLGDGHDPRIERIERIFDKATTATSIGKSGDHLVTVYLALKIFKLAIKADGEKRRGYIERALELLSETTANHK